MSVPITRIEQATPMVKPAMEVEGDVSIVTICIVTVIMMLEFVERFDIAVIDSG
jgi:hypothetical protein